MVAREFGLAREDTDRFGLGSQQRAAQAWREGRFAREIVPVDAAVLGEDGKPTGETRRVERDEGPCDTSLEKLAALNAIEPGGVHTAGKSSQVSDGASAALLPSPKLARELGLKARARILATTLVGVDPVTMLKGPIPATHKVLAATGLSIADIDVFAWAKAVEADPARVNPNRGAIALGHPTGCAAHRDRAPRARAHGRALRPRQHVLRRRARDRDDHRATLVVLTHIPYPGGGTSTPDVVAFWDRFGRHLHDPGRPAPSTRHRDLRRTRRVDAAGSPGCDRTVAGNHSVISVTPRRSTPGNAASTPAR
jgi:acetyl-CoA C-acetyltransferase